MTVGARGDITFVILMHSINMAKCGRVAGVVAAALALKLCLVQSVQGASWVANGALATARYNHTATLLPNGKVLVAGGYSDTLFYLSSAELYDPATGNWSSAGSMATNRSDLTATLLPNGKVLVVGGFNQSGFNINTYSSAELYDPVAGTWTNTGSLNVARAGHTATLLPNGKVLVAGGYVAGLGNPAAIIGSAELYDPVTGTWALTGGLTNARYAHTATLLPNGKVLVAGGQSTNIFLSSAELYDPVAGTWSVTGPLAIARAVHTATLLPNGKVLVAGGTSQSPSYLSSAELYNPTNGTWTATGSMANTREEHAATLLPSGKVLVTGGFGPFPFSSAELYDPASGTWSGTSAMTTSRELHTATVLPNGLVLVTGGGQQSGQDTVAISSTEVYDSTVGTWTTINPMSKVRDGHTATLLMDGTVLVAGGDYNFPTNATATERYNLATGTWAPSGLTTNRFYHTATLLASGKVLVAGGEYSDGDNDFLINKGELYDPVSGTWTNTGGLTTPRYGHTATLLRNGTVLVAGGEDSHSVLASAELYDPVMGTWTNTGTMSTARIYHTATLLPSGQVLVAGGQASVSATTPLSSAEIYNPVTGTWTTTASLNQERYSHTATLLPNGQVLVAGGTTDDEVYGDVYSSAELYNTNGTWTPAASMSDPREYHTATLLPDGRVLVAGGDNGAYSFASAELYDPASKTWTVTGSLIAAVIHHTATLLTNGEVLVAGGGIDTLPYATSSAELYDVGLGFNPVWQPQIASISSLLVLSNGLALTGSLFRGVSEGSDGNTQGSSSDHPVVQLRRLDNEQTLFLPTTNWSTNSFVSLPVTNFPTGWAMVTVFVNGIPSPSSILLVSSAAVSTVIVLTNPTRLPGGAFQFSFTNVSGAAFTALAATNVSLVLSNWTVLGGATEISAGQFQFTDPQATNYSQRFYRVRSP